MLNFRHKAVKKRVWIPAVALLSAGAAALAQNASVLKDATVYNRPVHMMSNGKLEVAIVKTGGSVLRMRLPAESDGLSPFGNPEMMPQIPDNRKLNGPMVGSFVAVDGFGSPSREEQQAGMVMHGEAYLLPWNLVSAEKQGAVQSAKFTADMPKLQEVFSRTYKMVDGENVLYVDSELESKVAFDRTINWGEHPFLFPPFMEAEKTVVDMSGTRAKTRSYPGRGGAGGRGAGAGRGGAQGAGVGRGPGGPGGPGGAAANPNIQRLTLVEGQDFTWPNAPMPDGKTLDLRAPPANATMTTHTTTLMDPSRKLAFITVLNTARRYMLGYVFHREEYPWVQNYMAYPADGWLGRGLEFATQPFDLPRREMVELNKMFDTPVYRWLPAKSKISTKFLIFWTKSPEGMVKVDDVKLENGKLIVEGSGKSFTLDASLGL